MKRIQEGPGWNNHENCEQKEMQEDQSQRQKNKTQRMNSIKGYQQA